jgi:hypothetical protein
LDENGTFVLAFINNLIGAKKKNYNQNWPFPNLLQWPRNNGSKSRLDLIKYSKCMKTSSPSSTWNYCFMVTETNSGKVYCQFVWFISKAFFLFPNMTHIPEMQAINGHFVKCEVYFHSLTSIQFLIHEMYHESTFIFLAQQCVCTTVN